MQMDSRASSWAMVARGPRAIDRYRSPGEKPLAVNVCTGVPLFGILGGVMCTWPKQPEVLR